MKIEYYREDEPLWTRTREVDFPPREGERIVWHGYVGNKSRYFLVSSVTHVYDDRRREGAADRVCVTLREVPGPGSSYRAFDAVVMRDSAIDPQPVQRSDPPA